MINPFHGCSKYSKPGPLYPLSPILSITPMVPSGRFAAGILGCQPGVEFGGFFQVLSLPLQINFWRNYPEGQQYEHKETSIHYNKRLLAEIEKHDFMDPIFHKARFVYLTLAAL